MRALCLGLFGTAIPMYTGYFVWGAKGEAIGLVLGLGFVVLIGTLWFGPPGKPRR